MGVVLGLFAGITYGAADFIAGIAARKSSIFAVTIFSQLAGLIVLVLISPILPPSHPQRDDIVFGLLSGVAGALGISLLYRALAIGRMSVVSPITAVVASIIPFATGLLMHERPSGLAIGGVLLALVSVVAVSTPDTQGEAGKNGGLRLHPGSIEAILSGVGIGGFYILIAHTHAQAGLWPLAAARFASFAIVATAALVARAQLLPRPQGWLPIACAGTLDMTANASYLIATRHGLLAIVAVLASLYPASTVLLARIILHEKLSKLQQAGVACALVAVALIAAGS